jgi:hypothetical protein
MKSYLFVALCLWISPIITAQNINIGIKWLVDEIPAQTNQQNLNLTFAVAENWNILSSYRHHFTEQQEFGGLPKIRTTIHSFKNIISTSLGHWGLNFAAGGIMNVYPDYSIAGDYHVGIRYTLPLATSFDGPSVLMHIYGEISQSRETSVATAIIERITSKDLTGSVDFNIQKIFTITGKYTRQYYSDLNERIQTYGIMLFHPFTSPWVAVGYAYAYSNSLYNNWSFINSVRIGIDPRTRQPIYEYSYFYKPYFTPVKEMGHLAIGIIQLSIIDHLAFYGKATVPLASTGLQKYSPSTGNTPAPIDYNLYYELAGILPRQYEASIVTDILDPISLKLNAEYFEKPYYSYYAIGINMTIAF